MSMGNGQFCTKPGLLFVPAASGLEDRIAALAGEKSAAPMLSEQIRSGYSEALAAGRGAARRTRDRRGGQVGRGSVAHDPRGDGVGPAVRSGGPDPGVLRSDRDRGVVRVGGGAAGRGPGVRRAAHGDHPWPGVGARHRRAAERAQRTRGPGGLERLADRRHGQLRPASRRAVSGHHLGADDLGGHRGDRPVPAAGHLPGRPRGGAAAAAAGGQPVAAAADGYDGVLQPA